MSKRYTDTEIFRKQFFRDLPPAYKLLWQYICLDCDHAGIWRVEWDVAQIRVGVNLPIEQEEALRLFNAGRGGEGQEPARVVVIDCGKKWFIQEFVYFQYGELDPVNRVHLSVLNILRDHGISYNGASKDTPPTPRKKEPAPVPKQASTDAKSLTARLCDLMRVNNSTVKLPASFDKWEAEADRLLHIDKRPIAEALSVLEFSQRDAFWKGNILSIPKFREKYDQLKMKMQSNGDINVRIEIPAGKYDSFK